MAPEIKEAITRAIEPILVRIAELEAREPLKYLGVYECGRKYNAGAFVTHRGSIWHCNRSTHATPGDGTADWTLACNKGRDGKDIGSGRG